jgi:branched-chain amino acid transport system permease protein
MWRTEPGSSKGRSRQQNSNRRSGWTLGIAKSAAQGFHRGICRHPRPHSESAFVSSALPYLINGLSFGMSMSLVALALALVWRTIGMIDFGLGAVYLLAAYAALYAKTHLGLPFAASMAVGLAAGPIVAVAIYLGIYRRFLRRNAALFVMVLVSLCVHVATQHGLAAFVSAQKFYLLDDIIPGWQIGGTRLNAVQVSKMLLSVSLLGALAFVCFRTRIGQTILAVADNKQLAQGIGIDIGKVHIVTYALAGFLVAVAALPEIAESGVDPYIATTPLFLGLAAIIVGGLSALQNAVFGAVLLGICFHLAVWAFSSEWQDIIAYSIVILVLLARPQGLFGGLHAVRERP